MHLPRVPVRTAPPRRNHKLHRARNHAPPRSIFPPPSVGLRWNLSDNDKTGKVPTLSVGWTNEHSRKSCEGCSLRDSACYAQNGAPGISLRSAQKADGIPTGAPVPLTYTAPNGTRYGGLRRPLRTLPEVIAATPRGVRFARLTAIGEAGIFPLSFWRDTFATLRASGMSALAYTHKWATRPDLAPYAVASCDGGNTLRATPETSAAALTEADRALASGYRIAAVVITREAWNDTTHTPAGHRVVKCPAQVTADRPRPVQCRDCGLCAPDYRPRAARPLVVSFRDHGPSQQSRDRHAAKRAAQSPVPTAPVPAAIEV